MLDDALLKLEQVIDQLIDNNQALTTQVEELNEERNQLNQKLQQLEDDHETLQLEGLEQEDRHKQTAERIKSMLARIETSSIAGE
ncbi:cell division protein ZapB [Gammaproteobacteria bacterium AS21]|jgi:FtsZ-binding cell division protein ZapB